MTYNPKQDTTSATSRERSKTPTDPRLPMTVEEVKDLLSATLHGPLPQNTVYRMMATLGDWLEPAKQIQQAKERETYWQDRSKEKTREIERLKSEIKKLAQEREGG